MVSIRYGAQPGTLSLDIDATLSQVAERSVEVTKFPIEDGAQISDHAIRKPETYRMEGAISNTPPRAPRYDREVAEDTSEAIKTAQPSWEPRRAESAREVLESLVGALVTIDTGAKVHEGMILQSVSFPRDPATGDAVSFSASFEKILRVSSEVAPVPKAAGGSKNKGGKHPTEKASGAVVKKKSAMKAAADWARGRK